MQEWIKIGTVDVPIIIDEGGEKYYPISYISEKVLLRSGKNGLIGKRNEKEFSKYIKRMMVEYNPINRQETRCINEEGLRLILGKTEIGRLSVQQRVSQNKLHNILDIPLISTKRHVIDYMGRDILNRHDNYTREIIKLDIEEHEKNGEKLQYQLCVKCDCHYPMTNRYFNPDSRATTGFIRTCKVCSGVVDKFSHIDLTANQMMKKGGKELFDAYKNNSVITIYEAYLEGKLNNMPDCFINKDDYLKLIKYLYDNGELSKSNLNWTNIKSISKLKKLESILNLYDIYTYLFGEDYYLYPWRYEKFKFVRHGINVNNELVKSIFFNYIKETNDDFDDPLSYNYTEILSKFHLGRFNSDILEKAVYLNDHKYAGYMFKVTSGNYYKNEDNLLFDLRYLVEQDMKIDVEKIPLYITKNVLQKKSQPIYRHIVTHGNGSLYYWFDKLYPDKFIETDFDINAYRLEFDSDTEAFIHDILKDKFKNRLIYNQRNGDREIRLNGMSPDWFIFTDNGVWIIEYYGMWHWKNRKNDRIRRYMRKSIDKMRRYRELENYNILNLYYEDIEDDYKGVVEKIKVIEDNME